MTSEFDFIRQLQKNHLPTWHSAWNQVGIGDDAAICDMTTQPQKRLAICTDTLVCGVHFTPDARPEDVGFKALATNLSDLAAMGATPLSALLNLTLPDVPGEWINRFFIGFDEMAKDAQVDLIGGDTTRGPLAIGITVLGSLPTGQALQRTGAQTGDWIGVSGTLGLAAWAFTDPNHAPQQARDKLHRPMPRLALGQYLLAKATAAIDISDGLFADLSHLLEASGKGALIDWSTLPLPADCSISAETLLGFGDDYELLFTMPSPVLAHSEIAKTLQALAPVHWIGQIVDKPGIQVSGDDHHMNRAGDNPPPLPTGWSHF